MEKTASYYKQMYDLAILAGACEKKARYFANKETYKKTKVNVFDKLGMTKKSKPTRDEVLFVVCTEQVSPTDLIMEYPFIRFSEDEIVEMMQSLEDEGLIELKDGFYISTQQGR